MILNLNTSLLQTNAKKDFKFQNDHIIRVQGLILINNTFLHTLICLLNLHLIACV